MISAMVSEREGRRGPGRSRPRPSHPPPPGGPGSGADLAFHPTDDGPGEGRCERLAVRGVLRRVHHQQHATGVFELRRIRILEHHAAKPTREHVRVPRDVHHVGVAKHGPEAGFARHVLPVDRIGAAELSEDAMDVVAGTSRESEDRTTWCPFSPGRAPCRARFECRAAYQSILTGRGSRMAPRSSPSGVVTSNTWT